MKSDIQLSRAVMRRVYLIYCGRQVCKPVPRLMIFCVLALALIGSVSIVNVVTNALVTSGAGGFVGLATFLLAAFVYAGPMVQFVSLAIAGMIGWAAFDTARNLHLAPSREV